MYVRNLEGFCVFQKITQVDSDEHVFKFVSAKLGYGEAMKRFVSTLSVNTLSAKSDEFFSR